MFSKALLLLTAAFGANAFCPAGRAQQCCTDLVPWNTNSTFFGGFCGLYPANQTSITGTYCNADSIDQCNAAGRKPACCVGNWNLGPRDQCALGIDCVKPYVYSTGPLPSGWAIDVPCAVDTPSRALANVQSFVFTDNTPSRCIAKCVSLGLKYAAVEYTSECHCGTGLKIGVDIAPSTVQDCAYPCSGDSSLSCGGSWRIQTFKRV